MFKRVVMKHRLLLLGIILLASLLRVAFLESLPAGFHRDEIISGYVGRFILSNGIDLYGNTFPLFYFDKYGDFPPVIPMYLSGLGTIIFGATAFATRVPVAMLGVLFLFPVYYVSLYFFKRKDIALLSSLLTAILPWHIVLSRATSEGIIALTVVGCGLYLVLLYRKTRKLSFFLISLLLFALSYLLYPSFRILIPLILLPLPLLSLKDKNMRNIIGIGFVVFLLLTLLISSTPWGKGRFSQTSLFSGDNKIRITQRSEILSNEEGHNQTLIARTFHNKGILYTRQAIDHYISYFSPQYLFLQGGLPYRYTTPDSGLIYLTLLPFLIVGVFGLIRRRTPEYIYLLYLLAISPLPSPLTIDDVPNIHRSIFMIVPLVLIISFGWYYFWQRMPKKFAPLLIGLSALLVVG